jgi:hypothetical protein
MATEAAVETTVQGLDPIARGVLDLSLRHDFSDTSIAQVMGRSDHDVAQLREQTMALVAAELGFEGDDALERARAELLTVPAEIWIGLPSAAADPEAPEREPAPDAEPGVDRDALDAPRTNAVVLLGLALAAALVVVLFLSRSGGDEPATDPPAQVEAPQAPADPQPGGNAEPAGEAPPDDAIVLQPLPGSSSGGTVAVSVSDDGVARVDLKGLREPGGVYSLWLFTSLISSEPLGSTDSGDGVITAQLPPDALSYAFLDLSLEGSPRDRLHSGRSVMRIATASVLEPPD